MNYKLESRLLGEIPTTSDMQKKKKKIPPCSPLDSKENKPGNRKGSQP